MLNGAAYPACHMIISIVQTNHVSSSNNKDKVVDGYFKTVNSSVIAEVKQ